MVVIFFSFTSLAETLPKDSCADKLLPEPIRHLLKGQFPSWKVLSLSDLHPENQRTWLDGEHRAKCPGIAVGHFESKERPSYAVALIPLNKDQPSFQLVVVN